VSASLLALLTAAFASAQQAPQPSAADANKKQDDTVVLSPFTVTSEKDAGYYAENTLAGSRLNTNLSDLASSITVVTKQQMEDTASLDINDVFRYEANTEGSSTYTPSILNRNTFKDTIGGYSADDGTATTNTQSNRVRGLAAPSLAMNNYPTNTRVPFDSYNTQSIEISRGPNSLLFGIGSPAGIVNQTSAQAVLNRNTNQVTARTDDVGSYRGAFSFNRSLIDDKLAIYGAVLYNNQQFVRKPSYELTRRQYAAITYKPFKSTTIRAFAENYNNNANRPNFITPRDFVTPWLQSGRPAYDPIARTITVLDTGKVNGPYVLSTLSPGYVEGMKASSAALTDSTSPWYLTGILFDNISRPIQRIDDGRVVDFFQRQPVLYRSAWTNPAMTNPTPANQGWVPQDPRYAIMDRQWTASNGMPAPAGYSTWNSPGVSDRSIYDWTKYNTNQANFGSVHASNYNIEFEQQILPNLFFSAGWFRQDVDSAENYTISQTTGATLTIDTNTNLINGSPNPYFGLPYITDSAPDTFYHPERDDNFRAMLAYDLDFTKHANWTKWFGRQRLLGLWSKQSVNSAAERWRNVFTAGDADGQLRYLPNPLIPVYRLWKGTSLYRNYYLGSPGDPQATVSQSTGFYGNKGWEGPYDTSIEVYNYNTGQFQQDQMTEQSVFTEEGSRRDQREVKSWQVSLQSYLWSDRLVSTLGWHHDDYRARNTTTGPLTNPDGSTVSPALTTADFFRSDGLVNYDLVMNRWNHWDELSGDTKTVGLAFRPLKGWDFIERRAASGSFIADFFENLTLYYNQSDNFNPPNTFQTDYFNKSLPKPTGKGKDGGFGISLFNNKLVARINWFTTDSNDERTTAASLLLGRLSYGDTTLMLPWAETVVRLRHGADPAVNGWNTDAVNDVSSGALQQEVWDLLKLPINYYSGISSGATQDSSAKGTELQLTYNPTNAWTMKLTAAKQETIFNNVAPQYDDWLAVRKPVWDAATAPDIPDFTDGAGTAYSVKNFWDSYGYSSAARQSNTNGWLDAKSYFDSVVVSQVALAKAQEGVAAANQRKYRASFLTNYVFSTGKLKGFSVGGSERWESKSAIGYKGYAANAAQGDMTINRADPNQPIYDGGNSYTDLWVAYTRRIMNDKVRMKIQLNVNNVTEGGHLEPVAVNFDGSPWAYRIIDSRQFILTTSFDF
jgi:outer membrane receptor protein involved in Fe transport